MLRANATDSSTTEACLIMDLSSRKTRVKQSNDIKGLGSSQFLHGGLWWFMKLTMLVPIIYIAKLNISHMTLLIQVQKSMNSYG